MNKTEHKIYIRNCTLYSEPKTQLEVWDNTKRIRVNNHRSDEAMFNDYSHLCLLQRYGFEYFYPGLGDIQCHIKLPIPGGAAWGSRRRLSYSLKTDKNGHPVHFPAVDVFRVQLDDAYNQTIDILESHYQCKTISQFLQKAGAR